MNGATKEDIRSLLHLASLGVIGAATIGIFFGVGFMWLADPRPTVPPANPASAQAPVPDEIPPRADTDTADGLSSDFLVEKVATTPTPDATVDQTPLAWRPKAMDTTVIPSAVVPRPSVLEGVRP